MKHMQMRANERRLHAPHVRSGSLRQTARALTAFALAQRGKTERPKKASALFMLFNYQRFIPDLLILPAFCVMCLCERWATLAAFFFN